MTGDEGIPWTEGYGSNGILDGVGVHPNAGTQMDQPLTEVRNQRFRLILAGSEALVRGIASYLGLGLVDFCSATLVLGGDFRVIILVDVMQPVTLMSSATGQSKWIAVDARMFG